MIVVAIDTSTPFTVVGSMRDGEIRHRAQIPPLGGRPRHSAFALAEAELAAEAVGGWSEVERIGIGIGPGSFTGLRIGITTGRALSQALGVALAPISSLKVLVTGAPPGGPALAAIDARRGELFASLHEDGREVWEPWVGPPPELAERVEGLEHPPIAVGDGAVAHREVLEEAGARIPADSDPAHRLDPADLCRLTVSAEVVALDRVTPTYLRRPDAVRWRERQADGR